MTAQYAYYRRWSSILDEAENHAIEQIDRGDYTRYCDVLKNPRDLQPALTALIDQVWPRYGTREEASITLPGLAHFGRSLSHITSNLRRADDAEVDVIVLRSTLADGPCSLTGISGGQMVRLLDEARSELASTRIRLGQEKARAKGTSLGRPAKLDDVAIAAIGKRLADGERPNRLAHEYGVSPTTIWRMSRARTLHELGESPSDVKDADGPQEQEAQPGRSV